MSKCNPPIVNQERVETLMRALITSGLGLDLNDPNLVGTPARVAKMYCTELFKGLYECEPDFASFPNDHNYNQLVISDRISFTSVCSHHFLPFTGYAWIGYIPKPENEGGRIVGLSKLARVVEHFACRPQLQENMTEQISEYLVEKIRPAGLIVVVRAEHMCMLCRGVRQKAGAGMITSSIYGVLEETAARAEAMSLIQLGMSVRD